MDWIAGRGRILESLKKYRHVLLVLLAGLFLMALPEPEEPDTQLQPATVEAAPSLQEALESILSQISGAGNVKVLLTEEKGKQTLYQSDDDSSADDIRRETVIITNAERQEEGLIKQVNPPVYLGAIVVCQGADNANVRLSIVEAVMSVTGLTSDRITVLKMK